MLAFARIQAMLNESPEKAHQLVALGLLARIFYASEPLGESRHFQSRFAMIHRKTALEKGKCTVFCVARVLTYERPGALAACASLMTGSAQGTQIETRNAKRQHFSEMRTS